MLRAAAVAVLLMALATIGAPFAGAGGPSIPSQTPSPPPVIAPLTPPENPITTEPPVNTQTTPASGTPASTPPSSGGQGSGESLDVKDYENQLISFAAGLVAAVISWYLIAIYFTPRLQISKLNRQRVEGNESSPSGFRYRVKLRNKSRFYGVSDLSLQARLVVKGLPKGLKGGAVVDRSIPIAVGEGNPFPTLDRRWKRHATLGDFERTYVFRVPDNLGSLTPDLPEKTRDRVRDKTATVDELMELGTDRFVRFAVSCSHARSGYRRTYSRKFSLTDIEEGQFKRNSVRIMPRMGGRSAAEPGPQEEGS
jgi:hypothetical protein